MNTNMTQEQISALVDGELGDFEAEAALAALRHAGGRDTWEIYHRIGDVLRSDEMALELSPDFSQRLFDRLEAEPIIIAPALAPAREAAAADAIVVPDVGVVLPSRRALKRFALPGMVAAAAVATVAFITTPQMMVAGTDDAPAAVAAAPVGQPVLANAAMETTAGVAPVVAVAKTKAAAAEPEEVILRDPRIDEYLFAHQRFSSSVYSTAQFARSSSFASTPGK